MGWEYQVTFLPMPYTWPPKKAPVVVPNIDEFMADSSTQEGLAEMGADNWELVSVQNVLRGYYQIRPYSHGSFVGEVDTGVAFGYPLTHGYVLFWKRQK